jgi:hypothetical protein
MTKRKFLTTYAETLKSRHLWARDPEHLSRYLNGVWAAITGEGDTWTPGGPALAHAWLILGGVGEPTRDALRALPEQ